MSAPVLYSFRRCPYAIRARMALQYAGVNLEHREILLKDKPQEMLDVSAKGTVPVLVLSDEVIDESIDVMQWALNQNDPDLWLALSQDHTLIHDNDGDFKKSLDQYKYFERYPQYDQQHYLAECLVHLEKLEASLVETQGKFFLLSPKVSALDIAIFPFIRQLAFVDKAVFDELNLPKLQVWLDHLLNSQLFLSVMEKHPLFISSAKTSAFDK